MLDGTADVFLALRLICVRGGGGRAVIASRGGLLLFTLQLQIGQTLQSDGLEGIVFSALRQRFVALLHIVAEHRRQGRGGDLRGAFFEGGQGGVVVDGAACTAGGEQQERQGQQQAAHYGASCGLASPAGTTTGWTALAGGLSLASTGASSRV